MLSNCDCGPISVQGRLLCGTVLKPRYPLSIDRRVIVTLALYMAVQGESKDLGTSTVLRVDAAEKRFVFEGVTAKPVPSLLRNFSAPVKMEVPACSVVCNCPSAQCCFNTMPRC